MTLRSALYEGTLVHARTTPARNPRMAPSAAAIPTAISLIGPDCATLM